MKLLNNKLPYPGNSSIPGDASRSSGIPIAIDELQKFAHGIEELTIGLRSRLLPVLRVDDGVHQDKISSAPEPPRAPLEHQLRGIGKQLQVISENLDDILRHLEL